MATDADVRELRDWVDELWNGVRQLRIDQHIFDETQEIIAKNAALHRPSHFYSWMQDMYVSGIAMAIRRQMDDDPRTRSFLRFLLRMRADPDAVSRVRYRHLYDGTTTERQLAPNGLLEDYVNRTYDKFVGVGQDSPSIAQVQGHIDSLRRTTKRFVEFANKVVAHGDSSPPAVLPTFGEVNDSVSTMESILQHYVQLLEGAYRSTDINWQYDWKAVFRIPWIV